MNLVSLATRNVGRNRFRTSLTLLGGAFAGIGGASRQLPWESLQAYPVSPRALFAAELVAGSTEVLARWVQVPAPKPYVHVHSDIVPHGLAAKRGGAHGDGGAPAASAWALPHSRAGPA